MKNVLCILTNGFEEIEAIGTFAILRRGHVNVDLTSLKNTPLVGRYGLNITNLQYMNEIDFNKYDSLFIAGGPQYAELENNKAFLNIINEFYKSNKIIAAICAGPTILGKLGLLKNRNYTCFNSMNEDFGGTYIDKYVVIDNNIITGKSAAATIEFAFAYLEALTGKENAENIKQQVYYYNK